LICFFWRLGSGRSSSWPPTPNCCDGRDAMIVGLIYGVAAIGVAIYMLVALVRPEKF
jgi:hypothetical protein